jgi:hypothetical protein
MKLRALALGAVLLAAAVPTSPASAAGRGHGWGWSAIGGYYPSTAYYYPAPSDGFGPVGPFTGYQAGYTDGHWHPPYWQLGHGRILRASYW